MRSQHRLLWGNWRGWWRALSDREAAACRRGLGWREIGRGGTVPSRCWSVVRVAGKGREGTAGQRARTDATAAGEIRGVLAVVLAVGVGCGVGEIGRRRRRCVPLLGQQFLSPTQTGVDAGWGEEPVVANLDELLGEYVKRKRRKNSSGGIAPLPSPRVRR